LFAIALLHPQPRLALLTLMPTIVLLLAPSAVVVSRVLEHHGSHGVVYRILIGFPTSFALVGGVRLLWEKALLRGRAPEDRRRVLIAVSLTILALAAPPTYPWNGRLFLQIHRPHPDLELRFLNETLNWFTRHRRLRPDCPILSDGATQWGLLSQLGFSARMIGVNRLRPPRLAARATPQALREAAREQPFCGVLVSIRDEAPPVRNSIVADLYPSWDARFASPRFLTTDGFRDAAEGLVAYGWRRTPVPPFYLLYEPPERTGGG